MQLLVNCVFPRKNRRHGHADSNTNLPRRIEVKRCLNSNRTVQQYCVLVLTIFMQRRVHCKKRFKARGLDNNCRAGNCTFACQNRRNILCFAFTSARRSERPCSMVTRSSTHVTLASVWPESCHEGCQMTTWCPREAPPSPQRLRGPPSRRRCH